MNNTVKSFTIVTGFSVVTRLLSFIFKIWMSRALGAETVGLYQIALSVLMLLFTLTAGAPTVLSRKVAEAAARGDIKRQNSLTTASIIIGVSVSAVLCGLFYGLNSHLSFLFSDERCLPIFLIMLPTLVTSTLYASLRSWFWGRKRFVEFSSTELLDEIIRIILSVIFAGGLVTFIGGAQGIALAMTLSDVLCVIVLGLLFFFAGGRLAKPHGFKEIISGTLPLSATRIITSLTASLTALIIPQQLIQTGMTVAAATAEYGRVAGMAFPLIMAPVTLVGALSVVLIPEIAQLHAKNDLQAVKQKLSNAFTFGVLVASVFFVLYMPLGGFLGKILFNDSTAGTFVANCAVMLFPISIAQVTTPILNSLGREKNTFINSLLGAVCILPCIFFLPKFIGVYAMAVGSGVCFAVIAALNIICIRKYVGGMEQLDKSMKTILFSIPLAILGTLGARLMIPVVGELVTTIISAVYLVFFIFVFVTAFDVIDITGYIRLMRPAVSPVRINHRGARARNTNKSRTRKHKTKNASDRSVDTAVCKQ